MGLGGGLQSLVDIAFNRAFYTVIGIQGRRVIPPQCVGIKRIEGHRLPLHLHLGCRLLGLPEGLGHNSYTGAHLKDIDHAGHRLGICRIHRLRHSTSHRWTHDYRVMHVRHIDIDAELGGAGRLGDGIDPLGLLADVLELGRGLQWRVSLNAQRLRGLDKGGIGVALVTMQDKTVFGA